MSDRVGPSCLRCATPTTGGTLFCAACVPDDFEYDHRETVEIQMPVALNYEVLDGPHPELGPTGTPESPRVIEIDPADGLTQKVLMRRGETVSAQSLAKVIKRGKTRPRSGGAPVVRIKETYNVWRLDRGQWENHIQYINHEDDQYLELWTKAGTREVTYRRSEPLSLHHSGEEIGEGIWDGLDALFGTS